MLSICIPVYNVDVSKLAYELNCQLEYSNTEGEIIIIDDGSDKYYRAINTYLHSLSNVRYYEQKNAGRAKTRNRLADLARFDKLVFLDGDCMVEPDFVANYAQPAIYQLPLAIGGLKYGTEPDQKDLRLRWNYGRKRESTICYDKNSLSFLSSNFMIDKELFHSIRFDENIKGYGHEDTLFGIQLRKQSIPFHQFDNKVIHLGLEPCRIFLNKTKESINNLWYIYNRNHLSELENNLIIKTLKTTHSPFVTRLANSLFKFTEDSISYILSNIYPSIFLFDVYKMLYIFHLKYTFNNKNTHK